MVGIGLLRFWRKYHTVQRVWHSHQHSLPTAANAHEIPTHKNSRSHAAHLVDKGVGSKRSHLPHIPRATPYYSACRVLRIFMIDAKQRRSAEDGRQSTIFHFDGLLKEGLGTCSMTYEVTRIVSKHGRCTPL